MDFPKGTTLIPIKEPDDAYIRMDCKYKVIQVQEYRWRRLEAFYNGESVFIQDLPIDLLSLYFRVEPPSITFIEALKEVK